MPRQRSVFICGAVRTPHGRFFGSLKDISAAELGAHVVREVLRKSAAPPDAVGSVYMGEVLTAGEGQNPARRAAVMGGLPLSCPAETINKVCASSLAALRHGARAIMLGEAECVIAGGMESMTRAPYLVRKQSRSMGERAVAEIGGIALDSLMYDGLTEASLGARPRMGEFADLCSRAHAISRDDQEFFSHESALRAGAAFRGGQTALQLVAIPLGEGKCLAHDETLRISDREAMRGLPPAFFETGVVTAATSSQIADGASAVLLVGAGAVRKFSFKPLARISAWTVFSGAPAQYATAPTEAIRRILAATRRVAADIDLFEINEAFAVVPIHAMRALTIPHEKVNVWGGSIAIGHPLGATGARIAGSLALQLSFYGKESGVAVACNGGGEAVAVLVERV